MSNSNTAVLSIDVQQSFPARDYWREDDVPAFRERITTLIDGATKKGCPVVRILHEDGDGAFSRASGLVKPLDWMPPTHAVEFVKHVHNAFTDTGLDRWLRTRGIRKLIVAGIRTEQCCETTTRVASDLGYDVDFVGEAMLTFPMTDPRSGRQFSAAEIRERTELVLRDRFARIATVEEALG
ncbi:MAG TPA: isochorismatase family protein [Rudaea sp.]|jgi:nicotinamidase-related amidase|uniref:isochorismatase family protein n=1 Tax=Rudaea sp. TaxID=2136325 RepID=UPI002F958DAF